MNDQETLNEQMTNTLGGASAGASAGAPASASTSAPAGAGEEVAPKSGGAPTKKTMMVALIVTVIIVLIVVIAYIVMSTKKLAARLTKCGWVLYMMKGCTYCEKQMMLIEGFKQYILYDSDGKYLGGYTDKPLVSFLEAGGFPYWKNMKTGEIRSGMQDVAALEVMAKC